MKRIPALIELSLKYSTVYDTCCDHGLIGKGILKKSSHIKKLVFNDIQEHLIIRLRLSFIDDRAEFVCSAADQLDIMNESLVIIAGVGAHTALKIYKSLEGQNCDFLLCIHKNIELIREYLCHQNAKYIEQKLIYENGHYYELLLISKDSSKLISAYGDEIFETELGQKYLLNRIEYFKKRKKSQEALEAQAYLSKLIN